MSDVNRHSARTVLSGLMEINPNSIRVAQSVECLTLDFGSGRELSFVRRNPLLDSMLNGESEILSLPFPLK